MTASLVAGSGLALGLGISRFARRLDLIGSGLGHGTGTITATKTLGSGVAPLVPLSVRDAVLSLS